MDKYVLFNQLRASITRFMESPSKEARKNVVFWAVKCTPHLEDSEDKEVLIQLVNMELKKMTYRELMNIFPIDKWYDGDKWESKDYFFTINYIKEHGGMDAYIEDPFDMVWDYQNEYIRMFGVKCMGYVRDIMKKETGIEPIEAFFHTDNMPKDSKNNLIGVDKNGRVHKVANPHSTRTTLRIIK